MASNSSLQISGSSSSSTNLLRPSGSTARQEEPYVPFSSLQQGANFATKVMVCRRWDASNTSGNYISTEFILSDYEGGAIHCVARKSIAHCFTSKLLVGEIYSLSRFSVLPNKETYRLRNSDAHLIQLEGNSIVRKLDCPPNGFMRFPVQLVAFENIALNNSRYLIDVIGSAVNIGRVRPTRNGSQILEFELMNERGRTIKITLWGSLCDDLLRRVRGAHDVYIILLPSMNVREFRGELFLSRTSATCIYDNNDNNEIVHLRQQMEGGVVPAANNDGTLLRLLQLGRERRGLNRMTSVTMHCTVRIMGIREQNSWHYYSCGAPNCRKGLKPVENSFWCESCDMVCEFPVPRFRIELEVSDPTATLYVTVFDEIAESMVRKPASTLLEGIWGNLEADDTEIPHDMLQLVGTSHILELKTHTYYDHGTYESFTASRLIRTILDNNLPPPGPDDPSEDASAILAKDAVPRTPTEVFISDGADLDTAGENCKDKSAALADSLQKKMPPEEKEVLADGDDATCAPITPVKTPLKRKFVAAPSPDDE